MTDPYQQGQSGEGQPQQAGPCRGCGMPLAVDQRYCLNCGLRRGDPRLDFRQHQMAGGTPTQGPPAVAATPLDSEDKPQRDYAPLAAAGGIAVLGLMLLIGVLIGRGDGTASAPAPAQVVRVQDEGKGSTASEEGAEEEAAGSKKKTKTKSPGKKAEDAGSLTNGTSGGGPVEASEDALQELQEKSPEEYAEATAKLPDEIATPGEAPPTDNKAPGGGSKGTAIE